MIRPAPWRVLIVGLPGFGVSAVGTGLWYGIRGGGTVAGQTGDGLVG
jgi:hypothetical protein